MCSCGPTKNLFYNQNRGFIIKLYGIHKGMLSGSLLTLGTKIYLWDISKIWTDTSRTVTRMLLIRGVFNSVLRIFEYEVYEITQQDTVCFKY